jgi:membrane protease YdiL (CAAX protease family)
MGLTLLWAYAIHLRNKKRGFVYVPVNEPRKGAFPSMVPVFLLVIIATPMLGALLEPITNLIPMSEWIQSLFEKMLDTSRPVDLVISTVILAPLCEELLCRGIICRGLLARGKPWFAIIFSAFIFALLHGNLKQGIAAFGLGIFMGWVYYKTHCLWCTIAIHFTNNALSVLMSFLFPDLPVTATYANLMPHGQYIALLVASAVLLAAIIYILYRNYKDDQSIISFKVRPAASGEALGRERAEE